MIPLDMCNINCMSKVKIGKYVLSKIFSFTELIAQSFFCRFY